MKKIKIGTLISLVVAPTGLPALFTPAYAPYQVGRY